MSAKISTLPAVVSANMQDTDLIPVVATGITSRATISEIRNKLGTTAPAGGRTVTSAAQYLLNNAVYNVKDYGAFGDGTTDDTVAIQAALTAAGNNFGKVLFPVGNYRVTSTLIVSNFCTLEGVDRWGSNIQFEGTGDCLSHSNTYNAGAYAVVRMTNFRITLKAGLVNYNAAIALNGTSSYINIDNVHLRGGFKFGVIMDQTEIGFVTRSTLEVGHFTPSGTVAATAGAATFSVSQAGKLVNGDIVQTSTTGRYLVSAFNGTTGCTLTKIKDGSSPTFTATAFETAIGSSAGAWIVNGPDRHGGANTQFSNFLGISHCQINGEQIGILDDGGYSHEFYHNNITCPLMLHASATRNMKFKMNAHEEQGQQSSESILLENRTHFTNTVVGPNSAFEIENNILLPDMKNNGVVIRSTANSGAVYHKQGRIKGNYCDELIGRIGFIDQTQLEDCEIGPNYDAATTSPHYYGVHEDTKANRTWEPPANTTDANKDMFFGKIGGNAMAVLSGRVRFPGIANPSVDPNTLDDYEEGSWTPAMVCGTSGTITLNTPTNSGKYIKIGRSVTVTVLLDVGSVSAPTGTLRLTGLPFASSNDPAGYAAAAISPDGLNASGATVMTGNIVQNATEIRIRHYAAGVASDTAAADIKAGSLIYVTLTYFAA